MSTKLIISQICPKSLNSFGGIKHHCESLRALFSNDHLVLQEILQDVSAFFFPMLKKYTFNPFSLFSEIKKHNPQIVHVHGFANISVVEVIIIAKMLRKKIVYSPHYHPMQYLEHPLFGKIFFQCFLRPVLPLVDTVVTISEIDKRFFRRYHKNVTSIPHHYEGDCAQVDNSRRKKNMILFVGRNEANKGLDHLYQLPSKYEVHCVTKGELQRKDFIKHSDISNEELSRLYSEASLVVIPSRYEAFSYVALEAFAHGTPVVMSDRVQIATYLKGKSGYSIFRYSDYEGFADAVEKTIGAQVDIEGIMPIFGKERVKDLYKSVYMQVMEGK